MRKISALFGVLLLGSASPGFAGTWACGSGCDIATLKGITWTPGDKCADAAEPEMKLGTPKAYNESAEATNKWIAKKQDYLKCLSEELNGDFSSAQQTLQDAARTSFDGIQKNFSTRVEELSKTLDEAVKKLNKK